MARLHVRNLRLSVIVGTYPHEREQPQTVLVNATLEIEDETACRSDELEDALDYEALCRRLAEGAADTRFFLLERLTEYLLDQVMAEPLVTMATVRVAKPAAVDAAEAIEFELTRRR